MDAKWLEAIRAGESAAGAGEMMQRFQHLRDSGLLPVSRGRNAKPVSRDQIVSGLLSVVSPRPGNAGTTATALRNLVPVGGADAGTSTPAQALRLAFGDRAVLDSILEIRLSDGEVDPNVKGRATVSHLDGETEQVT